jgi:hypothetical protein
LSTNNLLFVSKWSQARITGWRNMTPPALSLLVLPMAQGAVRVDAGYAREREYSGLPLDSKQGLVLARARCGSMTTPREGREAQAGVETHKGGGTQEGGGPFFGRGGCGAPCLAPDWDEEALESRKRTDARWRFNSWLRIEAGTMRGRGTISDFGKQTKTARGGFVLNYAPAPRGVS